MAKSPGNRLPYLFIGVGVVFVWAGWSNRSVLATLQDLVSGKKPEQGPSNLPKPASLGDILPPQTIPGSGSPDPNIDNPQDQSGIIGLAFSMNHGKFGDSQWASLKKLIEGESNFNPTARNPSSGAFGIAQALGHGTSATNGTMSNMYGGYGLTTAEARAANSGQSGPQIKWMLNYISATYGNPNTAYMKWLSRNPHWY